MPDMGIVMPLYHQESHYLRLALGSILTQDYPDFQLVIVIDGANERTRRVAEEEVGSDPRVHWMIKEENHGVSQALNSGFRWLMDQPHIHYLTWVSSDNIYYPLYLQTLRKHLRAGSPSLGLAYSSFRHIDHQGKPIDNINLKDFRNWQKKGKIHLLDCCFIGVSFMYKKKFAAKIAGYHLEPVEDYEYWLRLTEHCDISYVDQELMDYRVNSPHSISARLKKSKEQNRTWRYYFQLAKYQARIRRGIPTEATVLFPVTDDSEDTISHMEDILDQFYSNFYLLILDLSPSGSVGKMLSHISDPRIGVSSFPNPNRKEAITQTLPHIITPFTMLQLPDQPLNHMFHMQNLIETLREASPKEVTAYFSSTGAPALRNRLSQSVPIRGEIYRTSALQTYLRK